MNISLRTMANIEAGISDISVRNVGKVADLRTLKVSDLLQVEESCISNSFHNIKENASVQGYGNTRIEADREWMEISTRFAFLEQLISSLRAENEELRSR